MIKRLTNLISSQTLTIKVLLVLSIGLMTLPFLDVLKNISTTAWVAVACLVVGYNAYTYISLMKLKYAEVASGEPQAKPKEKNKLQGIDPQLFSQIEESLSSLQDMGTDMSDVGVTGLGSRGLVDVISEEPKIPNCAIILTDDPGSAFIIPHSSDHSAIRESIQGLTSMMKQKPALKFLKHESDLSPKFQRESPSKLGLSGTGNHIAVDFPINFISYN